MVDLYNSMLNPLDPTRLSTLSFLFDRHLLPRNACLVGGAVRDALLGRDRGYLDLDFVLSGDAVEVARRIAQQYRVGFVVLDAERQIARTVFPEGTADFARLEGETVEEDLQRRDFTINAIAYNPHENILIDPLGGMQDLRSGTITMVRASNLQDDPLRLLRAYRQAAQLNFTIASDTRSAIRQFAPLLNAIAAERVRAELDYLLENERGTHWLALAYSDGLLQDWLPTTSDRLARVAAVDKAIAIVSRHYPQWGDRLQNEGVSKSSSWQSLAKLACLVGEDPESAEERVLQLKYARSKLRTVVGAVQHLPQLRRGQSLSLREQYFFFQETRSLFPCLVLLGLAKGIEINQIKHLCDRYLNPQDEVAYPTPLVTGKDLLESVSLSPSPLIGELLTEIQVAQIEGKVTTVEEALLLAERLAASQKKAEGEALLKEIEE